MHTQSHINMTLRCNQSPDEGVCVHVCIGRNKCQNRNRDLKKHGGNGLAVFKKQSLILMGHLPSDNMQQEMS